jgi:hypothetical protein
MSNELSLDFEPSVELYREMQRRDPYLRDLIEALNTEE